MSHAESPDTPLRNRPVRFPLLSRLVAGVCLLSCLTGADWLQFRGNDVTGIARDAKLPTNWSGADGKTENVAWKKELPGRGLSSPIVIGNKVVVTASSGFNQDRLHVLCFDQASGQQQWERQYWATGRTMTHPKTNVASSTPASDGKRIFAQYSSNDVVCLDLNGDLLWYRGLTHDFPNASNSLGMASSPVVVGDTLICQVENDADSFATGLDVTTGKSRWKIVRPKRANWTSPVIMKDETGRQIAILQSSAGLEAIDPHSGSRIWDYSNGASTIPSSVVAQGLVLVPSHGITALRPKKEGGAESAWNDGKLNPGTASPIAIGDKLFVLNNAGVLNCAEVGTGNLAWRLRLKGPFTATPVGAGNLLVFFNEAGLGQVVDVSGPEGKLVSENDLKETILGTPAIANNAIYVRSDQHLWKLANK